MIIKLRNRLLTTIMGFIAVIMLTAFVVIFLITYIRTADEISAKLNSREQIEVTDSGQMLMNGQEIAGALEIRRITPEIGVYFNLTVDPEGNPVYVDSALNLDKEIYAQAAALATAAPEGGVVRLAGRKWQYLGNQNGSLILNDIARDNILHFRFLDITDSQQTLVNLAVTLAVLYAALLIIFFLLARSIANRAIKPMADAWESQQQFIADASHELKTPLSTLSTNLDILKQSREDTIGSQIKWINNSKQVLNRMTVLIQDMLELARVDEPGGKINPESLVLSELVDEIIDLYTPAAAAKAIDVSDAIPAGLSLCSDYNLLQQLFSILMDNAVKYTDENGRIAIQAALEKNEIHISFQNTGPGIAVWDLPKVFDRFYRGDKSRVYHDNSYGLGLAIAKSIVQKLNGRITVRSDSKCTSFTVILSGTCVRR